jgi:hypothetical protein
LKTLTTTRLLPGVAESEALGVGVLYSSVSMQRDLRIPVRLLKAAVTYSDVVSSLVFSSSSYVTAG